VSLRIFELLRFCETGEIVSPQLSVMVTAGDDGAFAGLGYRWALCGAYRAPTE